VLLCRHFKDALHAPVGRVGCELPVRGRTWLGCWPVPSVEGRGSPGTASAFSARAEAHQHVHALENMPAHRPGLTQQASASAGTTATVPARTVEGSDSRLTCRRSPQSTGCPWNERCPLPSPAQSPAARAR
jgi:hypothetical protein